MISNSEAFALLRSIEGIMPKYSRTMSTFKEELSFTNLDGELPSERMTIIRQIQRERKLRQNLTA